MVSGSERSIRVKPFWLDAQISYILFFNGLTPGVSFLWLVERIWTNSFTELVTAAGSRELNNAITVTSKKGMELESTAGVPAKEKITVSSSNVQKDYKYARHGAADTFVCNF